MIINLIFRKAGKSGTVSCIMVACKAFVMRWDKKVGVIKGITHSFPVSYKKTIFYLFH